MTIKKSFVQVTVSDITVVPHLQREIRKAKIQKISNPWIEEKVGTIELAELKDVDGKTIFHPMDGYHRTEAARIAAPNFVFDAVLWSGMTEEQVAKLFLARNQDSTRVPAFDQYELGIIARDPVSLEIRKAIKPRGIEVGLAANDHTHGAAASLMHVVREGKRRNSTWKDGRLVLEDTLDTIMDAWPTVGAPRWNGDITRAIGKIHAQWNGSIDHGRLVSKLSVRLPEDWTLMARATTKGWSAGSEGRPQALMRLFVEAYNARLGKGKQLT